MRITHTLPGFLRGTRISTLYGDVAVEDLRPGDLLVTSGGAAQPLAWIGSHLCVARLADPAERAALRPVRIAAGALGEGRPAYALSVSATQLVCLDEMLVPAGALVNGTTIRRGDAAGVLQHFHLKLPRHAVIYAEGVAVGSLGAAEMPALRGFFDIADSADGAAPVPTLPVVTGGAALDAIRARLAARGTTAGRPATGGAALHLLVDGVAVWPETHGADTARFVVPAGAREIRIVSRSVVPAERDPASTDTRRLGVCLRGLALRDGGFSLEVGPGYAGLTTGFHPAGDHHRWTSGDARLPAELFDGMPDGCVLELRLVHTGLRYAAAEQAPVPSAAAPTSEHLPA